MGHSINRMVRLGVLPVLITVFVLAAAAASTAYSQTETGITDAGANDTGATVNNETLQGAGVTPSVVCSQPALNLNQLRVYWASYADYTVGMLSDDFRVDNSGPGDALFAAVNGTINTGGVTAANIPIQLGTITEGGSASFTVEYMIPESLGGGQVFRSTIYMFAGDVCNNFYNYPEPYPGPCG